MQHAPEPGTLDEILSALKSTETTVREQAIRLLQAYRHKAAEEGQATEPTVEAAFEQDHVAQALLDAIEDTSFRVRATAALLLGNVVTTEAQEALIRHLQSDPVNHVRMMCVAALDWTPNTVQKVNAFITALQDPHEQVVFPACISLAKLGDKRAIEPLQAVLSHPSWNVRFYACDALVALQAVDEEVVSLLEELDQELEVEAHNEMVVSGSELARQFEPELDSDAADGDLMDSQAYTTQAVLERARCQLSSR